MKKAQVKSFWDLNEAQREEALDLFDYTSADEVQTWDFIVLGDADSEDSDDWTIYAQQEETGTRSHEKPGWVVYPISNNSAIRILWDEEEARYEFI